jgi:phosphohistidine swiveling domain-containing protein
MTSAMANPLHWNATDPDVLWSPGNVSEAIPGVSTALNWSFIDDAIEAAARNAFHSMGVLRRDELALGRRAEDRFMVCFYGRTVANIEAMRMIGDRTPGTSANAVEGQLFGVVRPDAVNHPTMAYVPTVLLRVPRTATRLRAEQLRLRAGLQQWWRAAILAPPSDLDAARQLLREARERYTRAFELGTLASMLAQGVYDQVAALAGSVTGPGGADGADPGVVHCLVTGYDGMLETTLLRDLWSLAHGRQDLVAFLLQHGFHGPDEGQIASRVWREQPAPLLALVERYAQLSDDHHPDAAISRQRAIRLEAEQQLTAALGTLRAPGAALTLRVAQALIPQREVGKANYTQALDVARLAARVIGRELVAAGALEDPEDVFGLTYEELTAANLPGDCRALAAERAGLRADYLTTELADRWLGPPQRLAPPGEQNESGDRGGRDGRNGSGASAGITGEGAGGGTVTGRVRVIVDPATEDLEPGEILVCHCTDPGWVSLFHLAGGVAVDMGGSMSHAAIVARELGIPCVTCTVDGTRRLHTGDLVELDGDRGRIEVIEREE